MRAIILFLAALLCSSVSLANPQQAVKNLDSSDPQTRMNAISELLLTRDIDHADVLLKIAGMAESDGDEEVRDLADNNLQNLSLLSERSPMQKLKRSVVVPELVQAFSSKEPVERRNALFIMRHMRLLSDEIVKLYGQALEDPDASVQRSAAECIGYALEHHPDHNDLRDLLTRAMDKPGITRDAAAPVLCCINADYASKEVQRLMDSPDRDARVMGAIIAAWNGRANEDAIMKGVTADDLVAGVHHRVAWVRAVATDKLFRTPPMFPLNGKTVLKAAASDPNPDVARDAKQRLAGKMPVNLPNFSYGLITRMQHTWERESASSRQAARTLSWSIAGAGVAAAGAGVYWIRARGHRERRPRLGTRPSGHNA